MQLAFLFKQIWNMFCDTIGLLVFLWSISNFITHAHAIHIHNIHIYIYIYLYIYHHQPVMPLLADGLHTTLWRVTLILLFPTFASILSLHLLFGFSLAFLQSLGYHSVGMLAHLLSSILATCPAHLLYRSLTVSTTSFTLGLSLMVSFLILSFQADV